MGSKDPSSKMSKIKLAVRSIAFHGVRFSTFVYVKMRPRAFQFRKISRVIPSPNKGGGDTLTCSLPSEYSDLSALIPL